MTPKSNDHKNLLGRSTAAVDNVQHFQKQFPLKECGFRENDSRTFQSEKRFCMNCFFDCVIQLRSD